MNEPALALDGVEKTYGTSRAGGLRVLAGASLTVAAGEVVALVAPSGAGKSTLLHIAGLLDSADSGSVRLGGVEMSRLSERQRTWARRREVGVVYQLHHLLPEFSASENVALPQLAAGSGRAAASERAEMLLESVGLADRSGHRPAALSGGEAQRVAFCRALANRPRLLLADEPTGNLDPATSERVFTTLMALVRETGLAALIATHDGALAARMDRTLTLDAGHVSSDARRFAVRA